MLGAHWSRGELTSSPPPNKLGDLVPVDMNHVTLTSMYVYMQWHHWIIEFIT